MKPAYRAAVFAAALAATLPAAAPLHANDNRLVTRSYDSEEVVRVEGRLGVQATITFGERELIENVAVGDAEKWQITPNKRADVLFVKPLAANARTNMTVLTDKRTYLFDLVAAPQNRPVYMLRFAYADEKPEQAPSVSRLTDAESALMAGDPAATPVDPASLNFAWRRQGTEKLLPLRVYDDGMATYLQFAGRQSAPAILIRNERGEEGPVNFAVRGDVIVVDGVPREIVLRSGKATATLRNLRPDAPPPAAASLARAEK
ncbi:MAG: TrbG/VirB9 family P-type conjugative transfer protein [Novosphingobium sp.]|nr:TrbG/VirB9 family P-type conjugative transfer protein [Novosphingobium sp.]